MNCKYRSSSDGCQKALHLSRLLLFSLSVLYLSLWGGYFWPRMQGVKVQKVGSFGLVFCSKHCRTIHTQRGNKVFVRIKGFHTSFVLVVPDTESLVISTAQNKFSSRMEQNATYPVIMAHLMNKQT